MTQITFEAARQRKRVAFLGGVPNFLEGCVICFCLISNYPAHQQPPVFGVHHMAGLFLQQSQVGRSENRQDNRLG